MRDFLEDYAPLIFLLVILTGFGLLVYSVAQSSASSISAQPQTRLVEQPSGGFNGHIYRDTKTNRLYIGSNSGGYHELNEEILVEDK